MSNLGDTELKGIRTIEILRVGLSNKFRLEVEFLDGRIGSEEITELEGFDTQVENLKKFILDK